MASEVFEWIRHSAGLRGDRTIYESEEGSLTFGDLDVFSKAVATWVAKHSDIERPVAVMTGRSELTAEDITEENANWKIVGFDWDTEKHMRAVDMVREGRIRIEDYQNLYGVVIRPITEADIGA